MTTKRNQRPRVAILGAGPIGIEAALAAARQEFAVDVYERGGAGEHVQRWGHVRLFTPFAMNASAASCAALAAAGVPVPPPEAILTGAEFVAQYLRPATQLDSGVVWRWGVDVCAVGRPGWFKADEIGRPSRAQAGFTLLIRSARAEHIAAADYVLDCTGVYGTHNWIGAGGIPCPGERTLLSAHDYAIPDVAGRDRERFAGRTTLVIGAGYSAATTVVALADLAATDGGRTRCVWLTRSTAPAPLSPITADRLPERRTLTERANALAAAGAVTWRPGQVVRALERDPATQEFRVHISPTAAPDVCETLVVDQIVGQVGYRPDRSLYEELQVHECYASQGPIKLAAKLLGETSGDCLAQPAHGVDVLRNPEPGFWILGAKSYGRNSQFLLQTGLQQVQAVIGAIAADSNLAGAASHD